MPPSLGLLHLRVLKLVGAAVLVFVFASLSHSVWVDPPAALRLGGARPEGTDAVALFRAATATGHGDIQE